MLTKEAMLSQTVSIGEAARMMDAWHEDLRQTALKLEKDVEREDLAKKRTMVSETALAYSAHVEALEAETRPIQLNIHRPNFAEAIKGKRNYASMQSALNDALANGKIDADGIALDIRRKLEWFRASSSAHQMLFPDLQNIITHPVDGFRAIVDGRITKQKADEVARLEAQRASIQAQEEAKARAAQEAILSAERVKMNEEVRAAAFEAATARAEAEAKLRAELEAAAVEERRKAAQIAEQTKPFKGHDTTSLMPTVRTMAEDRADLEGDTITIRTSEYHRLCEDALMLSCLRAAGVDNWEGWGDAMDDYHQSMEAA
jgi:hypothetical protein